MTFGFIKRIHRVKYDELKPGVMGTIRGVRTVVLSPLAKQLPEYQWQAVVDHEIEHLVQKWRVGLILYRPIFGKGWFRPRGAPKFWHAMRWESRALAHEALAVALQTGMSGFAAVSREVRRMYDFRVRELGAENLPTKAQMGRWCFGRFNQLAGGVG